MASCAGTVGAAIECVGTQGAVDDDGRSVLAVTGATHFGLASFSTKLAIPMVGTQKAFGLENKTRVPVYATFSLKNIVLGTTVVAQFGHINYIFKAAGETTGVEVAAVPLIAQAFDVDTFEVSTDSVLGIAVEETNGAEVELSEREAASIAPFSYPLAPGDALYVEFANPTTCDLSITSFKGVVDVVQC